MINFVNGHGLESTSTSCCDLVPGPASLQQIASLDISNRLDATVESFLRQSLSLYIFAIDSRKFDHFDRMFTPDVRTNYSEPLGEIIGIDNLKAKLAGSIDRFESTQHSLGTQHFASCGSDSALSVSYYVARHFFKTSTTSMMQNSSAVLTATARYEDVWHKQDDGSWRITNRNNVYMGPFIMDA